MYNKYIYSLNYTCKFTLINCIIVTFYSNQNIILKCLPKEKKQNNNKKAGRMAARPQLPREIGDRLSV